MSEGIDPRPAYTDTRRVKMGGSDGAMEFNGYTLDEVKDFLIFLHLQSGNLDSMTATFGDRGTRG